MKRVIIAIIAFLSVFSNAFAADFFLDRIDTNETKETRISSITIGTYSFINKSTASKYRDTLYFIYRVKSAAIKRYELGLMNSYELDTIANELEYMAFFMDTYFQNMKAYEKTGRIAYRDLASENLTDAKASYTRLQAFTRKQ